MISLNLSREDVIAAVEKKVFSPGDLWWKMDSIECLLLHRPALPGPRLQGSRLSLMLRNYFKVENPNNIGIQYYVNYLLFTSFFHRHHTAKYGDEQLRRLTSSVQ